jgi:putative transposase
VIDVGERRAFVQFARARDVSASRACELVKVSRRRLGYVRQAKDDELATRLMELAAAHPRYGCRRLRAMLRREGRVVNLKRVRRLCKKHGLMLKARRRRKRRGIGMGVPCKAEYPNHVWAYDFMEDRTETNRKLRILTIEDEFTRECVEIEVEHRMNAKFVAATLLRQFERRGVPEFIRSDNGSEFIAKHLMRVLAIHRVSARHIEPGSPWQNGFNERFNGSVRDECLNLETFHNRDHARAICKLYRRQYNEQRPHSSLAYQTPMEFAARWRRASPPGKIRKEEKEVADLSHCASSGCDGKGSGPTPQENRPDNRRMVHVGAPVASQQSRILRVDDTSVSKTIGAGKVSAQFK